VNILPALAAAAAGSPPVAIDRPEPLYWRWGGQVAYREGPWKIVADEALAKPELYNLAADLTESTDLASREPERLAEMLGRLRAHTEEVEREGPDWWRTEGWNGRQLPRKAPALSP
jgi:arylsulfatase A-like enzyme